MNASQAETGRDVKYREFSKIPPAAGVQESSARTEEAESLMLRPAVLYVCKLQYAFYNYGRLL